MRHAEAALPCAHFTVGGKWKQNPPFYLSQFLSLKWFRLWSCFSRTHLRWELQQNHRAVWRPLRGGFDFPAAAAEPRAGKFGHVWAGCPPTQRKKPFHLLATNAGHPRATLEDPTHTAVMPSCSQFTIHSLQPAAARVPSPCSRYLKIILTSLSNAE